MGKTETYQVCCLLKNCIWPVTRRIQGHMCKYLTSMVTIIVLARAWGRRRKRRRSSSRRTSRSKRRRRRRRRRRQNPRLNSNPNSSCDVKNRKGSPLLHCSVPSKRRRRRRRQNPRLNSNPNSSCDVKNRKGLPLPHCSWSQWQLKAVMITTYWKIQRKSCPHTITDEEVHSNPPGMCLKQDITWKRTTQRMPTLGWKRSIVDSMQIRQSRQACYWFAYHSSLSLSLSPSPLPLLFHSCFHIYHWTAYFVCTYSLCVSL